MAYPGNETSKENQNSRKKREVVTHRSLTTTNEQKADTHIREEIGTSR
jgi:hypothetical protein